MKFQARKSRRIPQPLKHGPQGLQPLEIALEFKQLHMVRHLQLPAPAQGAADVLHLAQHHTDLVVQVLQLLRMAAARSTLCSSSSSSCRWSGV